MRKSTKLAALVAGLVAICAITAVAAGWVNEGGAWYYLDKNGDYVVNEWKVDGGNYYYLGDDGEMLTSQLIEDGDNLYYVGADGARVHDTWIAIEADDEDSALDVDHRWYYFQSNGKAYKNNATKKSINGQKYSFDQDGKMLFGFVGESGEMINDQEDAPLSAVYYYGDNDNGALQTGWLLWTEGFTAEDKYDGKSEIWFFFNDSTGSKRGQKIFDTTKKIAGVTYLFDDKGVMMSGWNTVTDASPAGASTSEYFSGAESGALVKNQWIWKVPSAVINPDDNDADTSRWFYLDKNGDPITDKTKKINGKFYTFTEDGIMQYGLQFMEFVGDEKASKNSAANYKRVLVEAKAPADYTVADLKALKLDENIKIFYFSGDEKADGSMKTGTYKVDLDDDTASFTFDKYGRALNGLQNNKTKIYVNGMLLTAGDMKYKVVTFDNGDGEGEKEYLIGSTGTIVKNGKYVKDADDDYYAINKKGVIRKYFSDLDGAKDWAKSE